MLMHEQKSLLTCGKGGWGDSLALVKKKKWNKGGKEGKEGGRERKAKERS